LADHLRTELALEQRRPEAVIHHSDQGDPYTSVACTERCRKAGVSTEAGKVQSPTLRERSIPVRQQFPGQFA